jgi:hypothetical protein
MSSIIKGLEKRAKGVYRERIEGCTCDYTKETGWIHGDYTGPGVMWAWVVSRRRALLGAGIARTRTAARAAARAVVMERETRGLDGTGPWGEDLVGGGRASYRRVDYGVTWMVFRHDLDGAPPVGTAPTLAKARKAAREAT